MFPRETHRGRLHQSRGSGMGTGMWSTVNNSVMLGHKAARMQGQTIGRSQLLGRVSSLAESGAMESLHKVI